MPRGPAPIPTKLKIAAGNPGKRPLNQHEAKPDALDELPKPYPWLDKEAKSFWRQEGPALLKSGLLSVIDLPAFGLLCSAWSEAVHAARLLGKHGRWQTSKKTGFMAPTPFVGMDRTAKATFAKYCASFGMNPADRSRVKADGNAAKETALDTLLRRKAERKSAG